MTDDPVESRDLEPLQRSLDRIEEHLRAIRTYVGWTLAILAFPLIAFLVFWVVAFAAGANF